MIIGNYVYTPAGPNAYFVRPNFTPRQVEHKTSFGDSLSAESAPTVDSLPEEKIASLRDRLKQGRGDLTLQEWDDFLADLEEAGVITHDERFFANGTLHDIPEEVLRNGSMMTSASSAPSWSGNPLQWLNSMDVHALQNRLYANMNCQYAQGCSGQRDAYQKVSDIVKELLAQSPKSSSIPDRSQAAAVRWQEEFHLEQKKASVPRAEAAQPSAPASAAPDLLSRLSSSSQDILSRIKDGSPITQDEWDNLCADLQTQGAMDQADYAYTRGNYHLIPAGTTDPNGNFIPYEHIPGMEKELQRLSAQSAGPSVGLDAYFSDDWQGDPLAYLDSWMTELRDWRDHLGTQHNPDGSRRYPDLRPITEQIDVCQKVSGLISSLISAPSLDKITENA